MNNKEVEDKWNKVNEQFKEENGEDLAKGYTIKAVGYLSDDEDFEKGYVSVGFIDKLHAIFNQGPVLASMGHHDCVFCHNAKSSSEKVVKDDLNKIAYHFPEMIFHYMEKHDFRPPKEFIEFVVRPSIG